MWSGMSIEIYSRLIVRLQFIIFYYFICNQTISVEQSTMDVFVSDTEMIAPGNEVWCGSRAPVGIPDLVATAVWCKATVFYFTFTASSSAQAGTPYNFKKAGVFGCS